MKIKTLWLVLIVVFFNATGNLSLAWGMRHLPASVGLNPVNCTRAMLHPFVALGVGLLILWMLTRIALLSWADLSFVLPLTGLGYVLAAVLGKLFLNETITKAHWLGVLLIFLGMSVVSSTEPRLSRSGLS